MKRLEETQQELFVSLTGDLHRDLSEWGLSFEETWQAAGLALQRTIDRQGSEVLQTELPNILRMIHIEGILLGVKWARQR